MFLYFSCLFLFYHPLLTDQFSPDLNDYDAYGVKLVGNEHSLIFVNNALKFFAIGFGPYSKDTTFCTVPFFSATDYVYSIAAGKKQNASQPYFVHIGEDIVSGNQNVGVIGYYISLSNNTCTYAYLNIQNFSYSPSYHQDYYIIGVDPLGLIAYGATSIFSFLYNLNTYEIKIQKQNIVLPPPVSSYPIFIPYAIGMSEHFAVVAGYAFVFELNEYAPVACLIDLDLLTFNFTLISNVSLINDVAIPVTSAVTYTLQYDMAVDINEQNQILIGIPLFDTVVLLSANTTDLIILNTISRYNSYIGLGKSVAWIDNTTVAIIVYSLADSPWSSSTVYVYDIEYSFTLPIFAFPNNQQIGVSSSYLPVNPSFLLVRSWSSYMLVFDSMGRILIIHPSPPGYYSGSILNLYGIINVYSSVSCPAGTFKNSSGIGPCTVCPEGRKNQGDTGIQCDWCQKTSFCPLGSVNDVNYSIIENINNSQAYPKSPDNSIFDDILIQNMFSIGSTNHCIVVSPLFWTSIIIVLSILILIIMGTLTFFPTKHKHRILIKTIFKQLDLVGEGELWIGGLISLGIIVLVSFAYWFSNYYLKQYPIEKSSDSTFACDTSIRNAKFSTGLQLLSIPRSDEQEPIFDMLDKQEFTMSVDFVNTLYKYMNVTVQQNIGSSFVKLNISNYLVQNDNATFRVSVVLPFHQINVQFNLTGPYSIGGVRICLSGPSDGSDSYIIQQLNFCKFFYTPNQTLAYSSSIDLQLTKVINETEGLSDSDKTLYSGLWVPTFIINTLSDQLLYSQHGEYLRYFSTQTTLLVTVSETQFYIQNTQSPIARLSEVIFHNLLFTIVCLEIFGLIFLIIKLLFVPIVMKLLLKIQHKHNTRRISRPMNDVKSEKKDTVELETISTNSSPPI
ncbi:unnamed protein product [Didymodactylos carnosus]|uniref:Tyrosine-protein kinase ephrin type A/B receptor-like domain-containing protein n=1 Tax=Didymodactylos carnosus TaxID=1234261 RepID=A0A814S370_9BILA|nr:unnamed protein product [Didymodactylos carnosus]CAF3906275.1 unnamed protein product [Didymodactylos carnosus]